MYAIICKEHDLGERDLEPEGCRDRVPSINRDVWFTMHLYVVLYVHDTVNSLCARAVARAWVGATLRRRGEGRRWHRRQRQKGESRCHRPWRRPGTRQRGFNPSCSMLIVSIPPSWVGRGPSSTSSPSLQSEPMSNWSPTSPPSSPPSILRRRALCACYRLEFES